MATTSRLARLLVAVVLAASLGTSLAACGATTASPSARVVPRFGAAAEGHLRLTRGWATEVDAGPSPAASPSPSGGAMRTGTGMDMSRTSAAYFTLRNDGSAADALVSATSTAARQVQLHATRTSADGSSGTMTAVRDVPVPAGGSAVLRPGGYHLMLVGPVRTLEAGDSVELTLTFRSGAVMTVRLPVLDREDRPES